MKEHEVPEWMGVIDAVVRRVNPKPYVSDENSDLSQHLLMVILERKLEPPAKQHFFLLTKEAREHLSKERLRGIILDPDEAWQTKDVLDALETGNAPSLIEWMLDTVPETFADILDAYRSGYRPTSDAEKARLYRAARRAADMINSYPVGDRRASLLGDGPGSQRLLSAAAARAQYARDMDGA